MQERPTIPDTPGEPDVNWDLYHPVGASIMVKIPSVSGADYYQVYNGTSTTSKSVSRTFYSSSWEYIPSVGSGPNYIRIQACNSAGCSSESAPRRIVIFNNPSAPNVSVSPTVVGKGGTVKVDWNRPDGLIWSGAYFKLSCINNSGTDVCAQTIPHIGGSNKSEYSYSFNANEVSGYDIQVKACNKTDSYCSSSVMRTAYVAPAVPGDPAYNVAWDFYYPENTTMTLNLPQSIEGADSYDVYYYDEGTTPLKVSHVATSQKSINVNVGALGNHQLQLAACVTSRSGGYHCSGKSEGRRIVAFVPPVSPELSISPTKPALNDDVTVTWNRPDKLIWSGGYFKLSCVTNGNKDICDEKIDHIGGSHKAQYTHTFKASEVAQYSISVKACNKSDKSCTTSNYALFETAPSHGDPSYNVAWDFYYPENSLMKVTLSQTIEGADSFDVYYYPEAGTPKKVAHVGKNQQTINVNVGEKGNYSLQLAACITSDSGQYHCGEKSKAIRIVSFSKPDAPTVIVTPETANVNDTVTVNWNRPDNLIWSGGYFKVSCVGENGVEQCGEKIDHIGGSKKSEYTHELKVANASVLTFKVTACNKTDATCSSSNLVSKTIGQAQTPVLSATKHDMFLGDTTVLSWTNPKNVKTFNIWVEKPGQEPLLIVQGYTKTFFNRWIQNYPGVHTFYVEACQENGVCVASNRINITMKQGRVDQYPVLTSAKSSMVLGDKTLLTWTRPAETTHFNLWVIKPDQEAFAPWTGLTDTSFNRWIQNYPGIHTYFVEACNAKGECFSSNRVEVSVHPSLGVLEDLVLEAPERAFLKSKGSIKWKFTKTQERQYELTLFVKKPDGEQLVELASSSNNQASSFDYLFEKSGDHFFYVQACALVEQQQTIPVITDSLFTPVGEVSKTCSDLEPTKVTVSVINQEFLPENKGDELTWSSLPSGSTVTIESATCSDNCDMASLNWSLLATLKNGETSLALSNSEGKVYRIKVCFADGSCTSWMSVDAEPAKVETPQTPVMAQVPDASYSALGMIDADVDVNSAGNATYETSIEVPVAPGGFTPELSIQYSSAGGDSELGYGWALVGRSTIARCRRYLEEDGYYQGIQLDETDAVCLDGQRLVPEVAGSKLASGTTYRLKSEPNVKVEYLGNTGFVVYLPSGEQHTYGNVDNARVKEVASSTVYQWHLSKKSDTYGNVIHYEYQGSDTERLRLAKVTYAGNTVVFNYETRPDLYKRYFLGTLITDDKRLRSIVVTNHLNQDVNYYGFDYVASRASNRTLLDSIRQCAGQYGGCKTPTTFDYSDDVPTGLVENSHLISYDIKSAFGLTSLERPEIKLMDHDGDGKQELVILAAADDDVNFQIRNFAVSTTGISELGLLATGKSTRRHVGEDANEENVYVHRRNWHVTDLENDGQDEIQILPSNETEIYGDIFGDGVQRPVQKYDSEALGEIWDYWSACSQMSRCDATLDVVGLFDFNYDGLVDRLIGAWGMEVDAHTGRTFSSARSFILINTSKGQVFSERYIDPSVGMNSSVGGEIYSEKLQGDVNGDGYADFLGKCFDGVKFRSCSEVSSIDEPPRLGPHEEVAVHAYIDINGDGRDDYVFMEDKKVKAQLSHPTLKSEITLADVGDRIDGTPHIVGSGASQVLFADLDGDGQPAMIAFDQLSGIVYIWHDANQSNQPIDRLEHVRVEKGPTHEFGYTTLLNGHTADTDANTKHWGNGAAVKDVRSGGFVVSGWAAQTAANSTREDSEQRFAFDYEGLKVQAGGRGALGFKKVTKTNVSNGIVETTTYRQDAPFTGQPEIKERSYQGALLSRYSVTDWQTLSLFSGQVVKGVVKGSQTTTYVLDGENGHIEGSRKTDLKTETKSIDYEVVNNSYIRQSALTSIETDHIGGFTWHTQQSFQYDDEDTNNWYLARPTTKTVTSTLKRGSIEHSQSTQRYTTSYNDENRVEYTERGVSEEGTPESEQVYLKEAFTYDSYGNVLTTTQCSQHYADNCTTATINKGALPLYHILNRKHVEYDQGRHIRSESNGLFTEYTYSNHNAWGLPQTAVDPHGVTEIRRYDAFGQLYFSARADGSYASSIKSWCDNNCPQGATYRIENKASNAPTKVVYLDMFGRELGSDQQTLTGGWISQRNEYDNFGQLVKQSVPYQQGDTVYYEEKQYDVLGRRWLSTSPSGITKQERYVGATQYTHVSGTHNGPLSDYATINYTLSKTHNGFNLLTTAVDANAASTEYRYNELKLLSEVQDPDKQSVYIDYNAYGHKIFMNDLDKGQMSYANDAQGNVVKFTAADKSATLHSYDSLGREVQTNVLDTAGNTSKESQFEFDGAFLTRQSSTEGDLTRFTPDSFGRVKEVGRYLDGEQLTSSTTYDHLGRVFQEFDVSGDSRGVQYEYQNGYAIALKEARNSETVYYQAQQMDAFGNITQWQTGTGVTSNAQYDEKTGFLKSINTGHGVVQDLVFEYDGLGNLRARQDKNGDTARDNLLEVFGYDELNRLSAVTMNGVNTLSMSYYDNGNIKTKSDVQSGQYYQYSGKASRCATPAGTHAVSSIGQLSYCYDTRGNQTYAYDGGTRTRQVWYSYFDKPTRIVSQKAQTEFKYDAKNSRFQRIDKEGDKTTTTYYAGNTEVVIEAGSRQYRRYIGDFAIATVTGRVQTTRYMYKDHLGSTDVITAEDGALIERLSYDAFGRRRDGLTWGKIQQLYTDPSVQNALDITEKGFTGHEHVDHAEAIHMGGRIYDPTLGRFMQADPFVQEPTSAQSFNRYTYVFNNPLSYTDPTGYLCTQSGWTFEFCNGEEKQNEQDKAAGEAVSEQNVNRDIQGKEGESEAALNGTTKTETPSDNAVTLNPSDDDTTKAAGVLAVGWGGAAAEPTPAGEIVMGVATLAAAAYYGPELMEKMRTEIDGIMKKAAGPDGVQYSLRATKDGVYPCFNCSSGVTNLKAGDVWKFGETTNPTSRYSPTFLRTNNLRQVNEFHGNRVQIKVVEKMKIYNHALINFSLPPGNKIFR
ncbi:hypothetical protein NI389_05205 [Pseudoalteromonas xiamenensis]|uniref:RHS repeat-associated core domain-containing protein n=1 Tax=Pseudoalteromonas xiamenensis TaxID=882626 RepID=UPI0027E5060C|nr:RHS repeat-associated core domain-containing protein [Pseudoalteromonas xiamenensis]WMN60702.1 hypothetical protein NI389_04650 [Pseudoalteromonas xiamenensis]WMN60808.1 hypothetical protein NI389_05205 [Pseudoalteromonas xiamenensis]